MHAVNSLRSVPDTSTFEAVVQARDYLNQAITAHNDAPDWEDIADAGTSLGLDRGARKRVEQAVACLQRYLSSSVAPVIAPFTLSAFSLAWSLKEYTWP